MSLYLLPFSLKMALKVNYLAQVNDQCVCLTLRLASSNRLIRLSFAVRMGLEAAKLRM